MSLSLPVVRKYAPIIVLDDVRLIESEILAPLTAVTFEYSIIINKRMLPSCKLMRPIKTIVKFTVQSS